MPCSRGLWGTIPKQFPALGPDPTHRTVAHHIHGGLEVPRWGSVLGEAAIAMVFLAFLTSFHQPWRVEYGVSRMWSS